MAEPAVTDLVFFSSGLLFGKDWDYNFNNVLSFLTSDYDVTFGTITATTLTATTIYGDISNTTGIPGIDLNLIAGENITAGNALVMHTDGMAYKATNSTATGITRFIGFATETVVANGVNTVNASKSPYSGFTGLATGTIYYIGTAGALTSSFPSTNAYPIGYAKNTTTIVIFDRAQETTSFSNINISGLTTSSAVATDASKNLVSITNTGTGNNVLGTGATLSSPIFVTPTLGTPASGVLTNCTGLPVSSLTGTTLPGTIITSSLTSLGTISALLAGTIDASSTIHATGDIYTTQFTDYSSTSTITGWSSYTTKKIYYKKIGKTVFVVFSIEGVSNTIGADFTLPFAVNSNMEVYTSISVINSSSQTSTPGRCQVDASSSTASFSANYNPAGLAFGNSGTKAIRGQFFYETA